MRSGSSIVLVAVNKTSCLSPIDAKIRRDAEPFHVNDDLKDGCGSIAAVKDIVIEAVDLLKQYRLQSI